MKPDTLHPIETLKKIMEFCLQKHISLSIAESVTGGRLSTAFTIWPGSSQVLIEGLVCYTPVSKITRLNISPDMITQYGLVSREITLLMAQQTRKIMQTDIGIATTGNAGPEPNDSHARVGQTFFAFSSQVRDIVVSKEYQGDRTEIQSKLTEDIIRSLYVIMMEEEW